MKIQSSSIIPKRSSPLTPAPGNQPLKTQINWHFLVLYTQIYLVCSLLCVAFFTKHNDFVIRLCSCIHWFVLFLLLSSKYSIVRIYHIMTIYLPSKYFLVLIIMTKAAINILYKSYVFISLG